MTTCMCSDAECMVLGCKHWRAMVGRYAPPTYQPIPVCPVPQYQRFDPPPLTADEVRRIVREEVAAGRNRDKAA